MRLFLDKNPGVCDRNEQVARSVGANNSPAVLIYPVTLYICSVVNDFRKLFLVGG